MPPRVSILTICRNEAPRIGNTIDSILAQSEPPHEWIIKDGASTDGTLERLEASSSRISRLLSGPDAGIYDAMNQAAALATGDWLLFLNGGDALASPHALREMGAHLREGRGLVLGACRCVWPDGREPLVKSREGVLQADHFYRHTINHQSTFISRALFARLGPYDTRFRIAADYDFFTRCALAGEVVHCVPVLVAEYDMSGISATSKSSRNARRERANIRRHFPRSYRLRRCWGDWVRGLRRGAAP